jgi:glycosyltransferase involved in cell wall biosynthesis
VTNIATPYRAPLWAELGRLIPLTVALLAEDEHNRQWRVDLEDTTYRVLRCHARPVFRTDDTTFYAPSVVLLRALRRRPRAVVLDGWESPAYLAAMALCRALRIPVFASYRSTGLTHRFRGGPVAATRSWFMRSADGVLTAGTASTAAVTAMGVPRARVGEGFNTVDVQRFGAALDVEASSRDGHHFLYVGMLIPRKNVDGLLAAFAAMRGPADLLTIVGTGPEETVLRRQVADLGLGGRVRFRGHLDGRDLVEAYAQAQTFVLASHTEVWGLVVNEALAAGLHAVVSSTAGVAPEIDGMPGVFVAKPHPEDLARGMRCSRQRWNGRIRNHPIAAHTPLALAEVVAAMVSGPPGAVLVRGAR